MPWEGMRKVGVEGKRKDQFDITTLREKAAEASDLESFIDSLGLSMKSVVKEEFTKTSGAGGQNKNKRDTAVEAVVRVDLLPPVLSDALRQQYPRDTFSVKAGEQRTQGKNRELVRQKIFDKMRDALKERLDRETDAPQRVKQKRKDINKRNQQKGKQKREGRQKGRQLFDR